MIDNPSEELRTIQAPFANQSEGSGKSKLGLVLTNHTNYLSSHFVEVFKEIWSQQFQIPISETKKRMSEGNSLFLKFFSFEEIQNESDEQFVEKIFKTLISWLPNAGHDDFRKYCLFLKPESVLQALQMYETTKSADNTCKKIVFWHIDEVTLSCEEEYRLIWKKLVNLFKSYRNSETNILHMFYFTGKFPFHAVGLKAFPEAAPSLTRWIQLQPFTLNDNKLLIQQIIEESKNESLKVDINSTIFSNQTAKDLIAGIIKRLFEGNPRLSVLFVYFIKYCFEKMKEQNPQSPIFASLSEFKFFESEMMMEESRSFSIDFERNNRVYLSCGLLSSLIYNSIFGELPEFLEIYDPDSGAFALTQLGDVSATSSLYFEKKNDRNSFQIITTLILDDIYRNYFSGMLFSYEGFFFQKHLRSFEVAAPPLLDIIKQGNRIETMIYVNLWEKMLKLSVFRGNETKKLKFSEAFPFLKETSISDVEICDNFIPILLPPVDSSKEGRGINWNELSRSEIFENLKTMNYITPDEANELIKTLHHALYHLDKGFLIYCPSSSSCDGKLTIIFKNYLIDIKAKNEIDFKLDKTAIQKDIDASIHTETSSILIYFATKYENSLKGMLDKKNIVLNQGDVYYDSGDQPFFGQIGPSKIFTKKKKTENKIFQIPKGLQVVFLSKNSFDSLKKEGNEAEICLETYKEISKDLVSKFHEREEYLRELRESRYSDSNKKRTIGD